MKQDDPETDTRQQDAQDESDVIVSVSQAARLYDITEDGVRKRIKRGSLKGFKHRGEWKVILDADENDNPETDGQDDTGQTEQTESAVLSAQSLTLMQLELIRDTWLQPFVTQIADITAEKAVLQAELDRALSELSAYRDKADDEPESEARPWWKFWLL